LIDEPPRPILELSVRELVGAAEGFHRVGFERSQAWRRLSLGGEAHRRMLASRQAAFPGYLGEVSLSAEIDFPEFRARLAGRLDGALETERGLWLIEEYKTCPFGPDGRPVFPPEREARARLQLAAYCFLWERAGRGRPCGAIVLVDAAGEREEARRIDFAPGEISGEVLGRIRAAYHKGEAEGRRRAARASLAPSVAFPFPEIRPIQKQLIGTLDASLGAGRHVLAQAPTGSGKTAAVLYAALRQALAQGRRLAFLTAKTLQQEIVVETLNRMLPEGLRVLRLRAKERMCANDRILCHEDHCRFARDYPEKMERSGLLPRLLEMRTLLDPDTVYGQARAQEVCPFEVQLELASRADVLVGDYNYVFEPVAALSEFWPERRGDWILAVDEAHNLPDRARRIHSPEIRERDVAAVENLAALSAGEPWRRLGEALSRLRQFLVRCAEELGDAEDAAGEVSIDEDEYAEFLLGWDPAMVAYFEWKRESGDVSENDPVLALHFDLVRFGLELRFASGQRDFARIVERGTGGIRLALVCLDPFRALAPIVNGVSSSILLSATLEPFDMIRRLCGLAPRRTDALALPPPFPRENRRIVVVPSVRTTFSSRERNYGPIAGILADLADAHRGNDLAIFPSYRFLREVSARLPPTRARVLEQREDLTAFERSEILAALAAPPHDGLLFLAVSGGMFAEGVDYPGERLSGVFVVSPSLPQVSFERELLRRYFDEQDESGFEFAYILPGMTRVVQAAGRLIRSETDRGVIGLIGRRFLEEPYVRYLPSDWYADDPAELVARDPGRAVREFFEP
jgi:DNA excision repair protein ERCC-2